MYVGGIVFKTKSLLILVLYRTKYVKFLYQRQVILLNKSKKF